MNKLYRSSTDRVFAGVCGGLGEYLNIDSSMIRILWALSVLILGFGVLLYIISAIVIPLEPQASAEKKRDSRSPAPSPVSAIFPFLIGLFLILAGISALGHNLDWHIFHWHQLRNFLWIIFPALFIILGLALIFRTVLFDRRTSEGLPNPDAPESFKSKDPELKKSSEKKTDTKAYSKPPKEKAEKKFNDQAAQPPKKLYRNIRNRMISGVCSGIADYIDLDVSIVRLIWVLLTIMSAGIGGVIVYFVLVLVIPPKDE
jgi:phage shock protein C